MRGMRPTHRAALVAWAALQPLAMACSDDSAAPTRPGDTVQVDVDASAMPAEDDDAALGADSPFAPLDGGAYGPVDDAYAPVAACASCACGAGSFCYAGSAPSGSVAVTPCPGAAAAATAVIGCVALPSSCSSAPDCVCLLGEIGSGSPCYGACTTTPSGGFVVYCPP